MRRRPDQEEETVVNKVAIRLRSPRRTPKRVTALRMFTINRIATALWVVVPMNKFIFDSERILLQCLISTVMQITY